MKLLHCRTVDRETAKRQARDGRGNHLNASTQKNIHFSKSNLVCLWGSQRLALSRETFALAYGRRGDGETPSKRRAREPFRRGEIRESGKPKLAALASHTKGISCTNNKGNVSIPLYFNTQISKKKYWSYTRYVCPKNCHYLRWARELFGRGRSERVGNQSWLLWPATPRAFLAQISREMSQYPFF